MDIYAVLVAFVGVIIAGMGYSYELYVKAAKKEGEDFDPKKMKRTVGVSIVLGLVFAGGAYLKGTTLEEFELLFYGSGFGGFVVVLIDQGIAYLQKKYDPEPAPEDPDIEAAIDASNGTGPPK